MVSFQSNPQFLICSIHYQLMSLYLKVILLHLSQLCPVYLFYALSILWNLVLASTAQKAAKGLGLLICLVPWPHLSKFCGWFLIPRPESIPYWHNRQLFWTWVYASNGSSQDFLLPYQRSQRVLLHHQGLPKGLMGQRSLDPSFCTCLQEDYQVRSLSCRTRTLLSSSLELRKFWEFYQVPLLHSETRRTLSARLFAQRWGHQSANPSRRDRKSQSVMKFLIWWMLPFLRLRMSYSAWLSWRGGVQISKAENLWVQES